jgi:hypothetical protein
MKERSRVIESLLVCGLHSDLENARDITQCTGLEA